jgi:rare lipoprotein A
MSKYGVRTEVRRNMMGYWPVVRATLAALCLLALAACAETEVVAHAAKGVGPSNQTGNYKVGTPYQIAGTWYYPAVDMAYEETGIASWYGADFHGKRTANGEDYDMNELTAAHRTLPMPSIVRVTNLENGRSIKLRINDRGPFARGRILDVSRRGAQLLGFDTNGTARVRVQILENESRQVALLAQGKALPQTAVAAVPPPPIQSTSVAAPGGATPAKSPDPTLRAAGPKPGATREVASKAPTDEEILGPKGKVALVPVHPTKLYIQAGAFAEIVNANRTSAKLSGIGPVRVVQVENGSIPLFRVRIGPLASVEEADRALSAVASAGFPEAQIVVD